MKNILSKILIIFFAINLTSCSYFKKDESPRKTRIVGLDGQYREIETKTPEMNARILSSQGALSEEKKKFADMMKNAQDKKSAPSLPAVVDQNNKVAEVVDNTNKENAPLVEVAPDDSSKVQEIFADNDKKDNTIQEVDLSDPVTSSRAIKKPIFIKKTANKKGKIFVTKNVEKQEVGQDLQAPKKEVVATNSAKKKGLFVQVGSFQDMTNAKSTLASMSKFHKGYVETSEGEKTIYRVLLGPIANRAKANVIVSKIKASGQDAIVVRNR